MEKLDFKKQFKDLYTASAKSPAIIEVPPMKFLMIDGQGDPQSQPFQEAIQTLYGMSFTAKFMLKKDTSTPDYVVPPLEGLWYTQDMADFDLNEKGKWKWTLMIMQPEWFTQEAYEEARETLEKKKNPPALSRLRFETFHEGKSAQIMHIGPYDAEAATIRQLHTFINAQNHTLRGKHHEIYLSDPRRCQPERLKTIIRQPVR